MNIHLSKIEVVDLFGYLTYEIGRLDEHPVTFIIAKNGMGKTTILRLLEGLSSHKWNVFKTTDYSSLTFTFSVSEIYEKVVFTKDDAGKVTWSVAGRDFSELPSGYYALTSDQERAEWLEERFEEVQRAHCGRHWTVNGRGHYDADEVIAQMKEKIQELPQSGEKREELGFLVDWSASLIPARRLIEIDNTSDTANNQDVVNTISKQMSDEMKEHVVQTTGFSRTLEHDFLLDLLSNVKKEQPSIESLKKRLEKVNDSESKAQEYGLYPESEKIKLPDRDPNRDLDSSQIRLLDTYLTNKEERIKPHHEFLARLNLFERLVNTSLSRKTIKPNQTDGLIVVRDEDIRLKLDQLSSGEQHLIIMAYKLIFSIPNDSYVLIDEPELSMHLEWQEGFASMLDEIGELRNLWFLCATHSPSIVDSRISELRDIK